MIVNNIDVTKPDRDLNKGHPLLRFRWPILKKELEGQHGIITMENEIYRPDERQQYLYGGGRTPEALIEKVVNIAFARPSEPIVTNAWSARTSPHGWTINGQPAAAAIDVVPVGNDGKPWTKDDRWEELVEVIAKIGAMFGLMHFHAPGKAVWDKPHLQLVEWSDREHRLILPE